MAGDLVLAPSQDGVLHAIQLADGIERWRFAPGTSVTGTYVQDGQVFLTDGRGIVHSLDLGTGTERWASTEILDSASTPIADSGRVIVSTGGGELVALDASTGAGLWRVRISTSSAHDPTLADGIVYLSAGDGAVQALRADNGTQVWKINVGPDPVGTPAVAAGVVYVGSRSAEPGGRLRALDAATGAILWQTDGPSFSPAVSGDIAVSVGDDGLIVARDARTGGERWRLGTNSTTRGPAIVDSTVFVGVDHDQWIGAIDLATGRLLWRYDVDGSNQCCIAVAKGYVVVGTMAGSVYAIGGDGSVVSPQPSDLLGSPAATSARPTPPSPQGHPVFRAALPEPFTVIARHSAAALGLDRPIALAIGPSGDAYVSDLSMRITQLTAEGEVIRRLGRARLLGGSSSTSQPAATNANPKSGPIDVAPDGTVYVSDSDNHRVQVFSADGRFIRRFGSLGSEPGQFTIPFDLSADADGNVYVTDDGLDAPDEVLARAVTRCGSWMSWTNPRLDGHLHDADSDAEGRDRRS